MMFDIEIADFAVENTSKFERVLNLKHQSCDICGNEEMIASYCYATWYIDDYIRICTRCWNYIFNLDDKPLKFIQNIGDQIFDHHLDEKVEEHIKRHEEEMGTNDKGEHYICGLRKVNTMLKNILQARLEMI